MAHQSSRSIIAINHGTMRPYRSSTRGFSPTIETFGFGKDSRSTTPANGKWGKRDATTSGLSSAGLILTGTGSGFSPEHRKQALRCTSKQDLSLGGVCAPFVIAGASDVRHRRERSRRHPFAFRGHPFKLPGCLDNVPSPFSLGRIALAAVETEDLVTGSVPILTTAGFVQFAAYNAELPKAASRQAVKWRTLRTEHHASDIVRSGCDAFALLNNGGWTCIATDPVKFAVSSEDLRAEG
jgi:hypothetical protein